MEKDRGKLTALTDIQIKILESEIEKIDGYSHPIFIESKDSISSREIFILKENPWIILQLCAMHFYDHAFRKSGTENNVVETMFFMENEIDDVWLLIKKLFQKSLFFKTVVIPDNNKVYKVDIMGISDFGETVLSVLNDKGIIPKMWTELYLTSKYPLSEKEGMYIFTDLLHCKEIDVEDVMSKLLTNSFFRSMDISTIPLAYCENNEGVQRILKRSREAIVFVEDEGTISFKRICWRL